MSGVPYVGRYPDSDGSLVHKQYVDARYGQVAVDLSYVNASSAIKAATLVTQTYVDSGDATRAKKTSVDTADANYVLLTKKGVANGVATIGADGYIPSAQLPAIVTERKTDFRNVTTTYLISRTLTTTVPKEYLAATISVTDPGFPYYPLVFGSITGQCGPEQNPLRRKGGGSIGKALVLSQTDQIWGAGLAESSFQPSETQIQPFCDASSTPTTIPPVTGSMTLNLYLSLWSGVTYTFTNSNFSFYAILVSGV